MAERRASLTEPRIEHLLDRVTLLPGDLLDQLSLIRVLEKVQPDELYNLASQSFVPTSFEQPLLTGEFTALGVTRVLFGALMACHGAQKTLGAFGGVPAEAPARAEEIHHAGEEGVEFHWLTNPVEVLDDGKGGVRGMRCVRMELGEPDDSGRRRPVPHRRVRR